MTGSRRTAGPEWPATYYDGRTADRQDVIVALAPDGGGLEIRRADGARTFWRFEDLRQTQGGFSSEQVRVEHGTDPVEVVFVTAPGFVAAIRAASPAGRGAFRRQYQTARITAWSLGAIAAAVALYIWGAPLAAMYVAARVPPEWEASLGRRTVADMAPPDVRCTDDPGLADLNAVFDRLVKAQGTSPYTFQLYVVRDTTVNAFAAPGGFIVVNRGLLRAARTPEELAGVLAHEIQHVTQQHSTRAIVREVPLRVVIAAITGGGMETVAGIAATVGVLRYRRGDELEADREGMRLLQAARVDPAGAVSFMETLAGRGGPGESRIVSYVSTHPHTADRVAQLRALADSARHTPVPLLDAAAWMRVQTICGASAPRAR